MLIADELVNDAVPETDEVTVSNRGHAGDGFCGSEINLLQLRPVRRRTQHFAIKHARTPDVRRIPMGAGDDLVGADALNGCPKDAPLLHFREDQLALPQLQERGDHGEHDPHVAVGARP